MRESPRTRRLRSDLKALQRLKGESTLFDFTAYGDPPHTYLLRFHGRGAAKTNANSPVTARDHHEVRVELGASYPRLQPELAWQTPIFHPNISAGGVVCLGGYGTYWVPSLNLDELCEMLWDMIRYANLDVNSPYNREAAAWAKVQSDRQFPLDPRPIRDRVFNGERAPAAAQDDGQLPGVPVAGTIAAPPAGPPETPSPVASPAAQPMVPPPVAAPVTSPPSAPASDDILFLDEPDIVEAEAVDEDPDILIIE
jgi:ubiquitin-protein ligase